jgi:hypothetical protein
MAWLLGALFKTTVSEYIRKVKMHNFRVISWAYVAHVINGAIFLLFGL